MACAKAVKFCGCPPALSPAVQAVLPPVEGGLYAWDVNHPVHLERVQP